MRRVGSDYRPSSAVGDIRRRRRRYLDVEWVDSKIVGDKAIRAQEAKCLESEEADDIPNLQRRRDSIAVRVLARRRRVRLPCCRLHLAALCGLLSHRGAAEIDAAVTTHVLSLSHGVNALAMVTE
jgi:hypothetical protein